MPRQVGKTHRVANLAVFIKERFAQFAVAKTAAQPGYGFAFHVGVAFGHAAHSFSSDVAGNVGFHFYEDKAAVATVLDVLFENGMAGSARTREAIQN